MKMKKRYLLGAALVVGFVALSYKGYLSGNIWDDIKSKFSDAKDAASSTYDKTINELKRAPACAEVVAKGIEWSAMQGAYYTAKGTLELSKTLQNADPRMNALRAKAAALQAAVTSLDATMAAGSAGVDVVAAAGKWGVQTISDLGNVVASLFLYGINLQKAEFEVNVEDVKKGKLPMVGIAGVFAGKKVDTQVQINFKDMKETLISVAKAIKGVVAP